MWLGIMVLCTFGAAALLSAYFAIRSAIHGRWHMTIGLCIPALGLGGALVYIVGPTVWLEIAGPPNLEPVPAQAQLLTPEELVSLFSGRTHEGTRHDDGEWHIYTATYDAAGTFTRQSGPENSPARLATRGTWLVEDGSLCLDPADATPDCFAIYRDGDGFAVANDRDEVVKRFRVTEAAAADDGDNGTG